MAVRHANSERHCLTLDGPFDIEGEDVPEGWQTALSGATVELNDAAYAHFGQSEIDPRCGDSGTAFRPEDEYDYFSQRHQLMGRNMQFLTLPDLRIDEVSPDAVGAFVVTLDEIAVLANAIVQSRLAIDDWEFSSLVGMEPSEADQMRQALVHVLRTHRSPQT
ncbi:hypothetical protein GCM10009587_32520 [Microbacterium maritypicum]